MGKGVAATFVCAATLAGCGSDGGGAETDARPPLSRAQYAQIYRLYRAQLPLDRANDAEDPTEIRRAARKAARSCRAIDHRDPLLAALVDGCERSMSTLAELANLDCQTERECTKLMNDTADVMDDLATTVRSNEPVFEREVPDEACRKALTAPESVDAGAEYADAIRAANAAIESGDPDKIKTTTAELENASAALDATPSARETLEDFRAACGPPR